MSTSAPRRKKENVSAQASGDRFLEMQLSKSPMLPNLSGLKAEYASADL